jgi:hypothetical protein
VTTTELIKQLQEIEAKHGVQRVFMQITTSGLDWTDENGNRFDRWNSRASQIKVDVDPTKEVWVVGRYYNRRKK